MKPSGDEQVPNEDKGKKKTNDEEKEKIDTSTKFTFDFLQATEVYRIVKS